MGRISLKDGGLANEQTAIGVPQAIWPALSSTLGAVFALVSADACVLRSREFINVRLASRPKNWENPTDDLVERAYRCKRRLRPPFRNLHD